MSLKKYVFFSCLPLSLFFVYGCSGSFKSLDSPVSEEPGFTLGQEPEERKKFLYISSNMTSFNHTYKTIFHDDYAYAVSKDDNLIIKCETGATTLLNRCLNSGATGLDSPVGIAFHGSKAYISNQDSAIITTCDVAQDGSLNSCENITNTYLDSQLNNQKHIAVHGDYIYVTSNDNIYACNVVEDKNLEQCVLSGVESDLQDTSGVVFHNSKAYIINSDHNEITRCGVTHSGLFDPSTCDYFPIGNYPIDFALNNQNAYALLDNGDIIKCDMNGDDIEYLTCAPLTGKPHTAYHTKGISLLGSRIYASTPGDEIATCPLNNGNTLSGCESTGKIAPVLKCELNQSNGSLNSCVDAGVGALPGGVYNMSKNENYLYLLSSPVVTPSSVVTKCSIDQNSGLLQNCSDLAESNLGYFNTIGFSENYAYLLQDNNTIYKCEINKSNGSFHPCDDSSSLAQPPSFSVKIASGYAYVPSPDGFVTKCSVSEGGEFNSCDQTAGSNIIGFHPVSIDIRGSNAYIADEGNGSIVKCNVNKADGSLTSCGPELQDSEFITNIFGIFAAEKDVYITTQNDHKLLKCPRAHDGSLSSCEDTGVNQLQPSSIFGN